jgi:hypothetical protein
MATILVGVGIRQEKFVVHQELLCSKSQYFAKALTGSFEESKTGIVKLDDLHPVLFRIMVTWLYNGKIVYTVVNNSSNIDHDFAKVECAKVTTRGLKVHEDSSTWPKEVLVRLFVLADRLDMKELRNNTIDALITAVERSRTGLKICTYKFIDANTTEESLLRKFAVNRLAYVYADSPSCSC